MEDQVMIVSYPKAKKKKHVIKKTGKMEAGDFSVGKLNSFFCSQFVKF